MTDSHRPRHSLDDDNFDEAFAFDDDPAREEHATAAASATADEGAGLPYRGLAMILTAVAVLLIGWGLFTTFGGGEKDTDTEAASQTSAQQAQQSQPGSSPAAGASAGAGAPGAAGASGQPSPSAPAPSPSAKPSEPQQGGQQAAPGVVDRANQQITVLNNSPIQGLASGTANKLRGNQWAKTSYGNLPDSQGAFPKSVVLYPAGDAAAQAAAEAAAADLGLRAQTRNPEIDRALSGAKMLQGDGPAAVVVVTTNDMPR